MYLCVILLSEHDLIGYHGSKKGYAGVLPVSRLMTVEGFHQTLQEGN